jgi:hypothetical protein
LGRDLPLRELAAVSSSGSVAELKFLVDFHLVLILKAVP